MSRQGNSPPPHLQPVPDEDFTLDIPEEEKPPIMEQRRYTTTAWRQLGSAVHYCLPRGDKPIDDDEGEELHITDPDLERLARRYPQAEAQRRDLPSARRGRGHLLRARSARSTRRSSRRAPRSESLPASPLAGGTRPIATSILFKLRDDEAKRLDDEYSAFRPKAFTLDDERRGVIVRYAPPIKRGSKAHLVTTLLARLADLGSRRQSL